MAYLDGSGLTYFWSKIKSYVNNKTGHTKLSVSLTAAGWALNNDGYYYQTVSVAGVTASNDVIVDTGNSKIRCTAQTAGSLTFRATAQESATVKVMIFS